MKEVYGDLWAYEDRKGFYILITTNGFIKNNGEGVMGAGVARQAAEKYPELPRLLGQSLIRRGNVVSRLTDQIFSFPVKHEWFRDADLKLIKKSVAELNRRASGNPKRKYVLPRPGCGSGNLTWTKVRPLMEGLPDNVFVIERENLNGRKAKNGNGSSGRKVR